MKTLSTEAHPVMPGHVQITAALTMRSGTERFLCNPLPELAAAMDEGVPFMAHSVKGMQPIEIIVNPAHVGTIEAAS